MRIAIFGLGHVGKALLRAFGRIQGQPQLVLAVDGQGAFLGDDLDPVEVLRRKESREYDRQRQEGDTGGLLDEARPDLHIELTPTNLEHGRPALPDLRAALARRIPVVSAAKSHQANRELLAETLELARGVPFLDHASTLAGIPATEMVAGIGMELRGIEGVLNGTTNFILQRLLEGAAFDQARDEAVERGFAERDWRYDLEGLDVAVKLVGLVRHLTGHVMGASEVELRGLPEHGLTRGIVGATPAFVQGLAREGKALKLIGSVQVSPAGEVRASVGPRVLPAADPFASINGFTNAIRLDGVMNGTPMELFLRGPGAGADETASRVLGNVNHLVEVLAWGGRQ